MENEYINQDIFEKAVLMALQKNSKSSVMFLLRERLTREILETALPYLVEPLLKKIKELEQELEQERTKASNRGSSSPRLNQIKEAISDIVHVIDSEDPMNDN
jgi:hypothetical protein